MVTIEVMELHATCTIIDLKIMNTVFRSPTKQEWITNTLNEYMRNLYSNEYYLIIRENKAWKKKTKNKKNKNKKTGPHGSSTPDLCDTSAALYQLSWQASWELIIFLVRNKTVKQ